MPNFDKTGPNGQGPMTGKGMGPCGGGSAWGRKRFGCGRGFGWFGQRNSTQDTQDYIDQLKQEITAAEDYLKSLDKQQ